MPGIDVEEMRMDIEILTKARKLNAVLLGCQIDKEYYNRVCEILSDLTESKVYLVNRRGEPLGYCIGMRPGGPLPKSIQSRALTGCGLEAAKMDNQVNPAMRKTNANSMYISTAGARRCKSILRIPVIGENKTIGALHMEKPYPFFSLCDQTLGECAAAVLGIVLCQKNHLEYEEHERQIRAARSTFKTLSFAEREAIKRVSEELEDDEGTIVASRIAEKSRISCSIIVTALRKLQSAGAVEANSVGRRGTHICVLNYKLYDLILELVCKSVREAPHSVEG